MGRVLQARAIRGSQRWIQDLVNTHPAVLDAAIGMGPIEWRAPLAADDFAEYRDAEFLGRLGVTLGSRSLPAFWPDGGPQWDALGRTETGTVVLLEAKAHLAELFSSSSRATPQSLVRIRQALDEVADALGATPGCDWATHFYQVTNRLAHAYLLHVLNAIPTRLVFLYLIGDEDMDGPRTRREWEAALAVIEEALGLRGRMPPYVTHAYVDVSGPVPRMP